MRRPIRLATVPAAILLLGLAGCIVETPATHDVVVERPAPATIYVAPAPATVTP